MLITKYKQDVYYRNRYIRVDTWEVTFLPKREILANIQAQLRKLTTYHTAIQYQNPYWDGNNWVDDDFEVPF